MADLKTRPTDQPVSEFLDLIDNADRRADCDTISHMMEKATGAKPVMWGDSIVGFGKYHYKYASGREADWPLVGFSPRKQNLTLYITAGFSQYQELLEQLGKCKTSVGCLYIKRLSDVNLDVLEELVTKSVGAMRQQYPD